MVRKASIYTLQDMSYKQLTLRRDRLTDELAEVRRKIKRAPKKTKAIKALRKRREVIRTELRKTNRYRKKKWTPDIYGRIKW